MGSLRGTEVYYQKFIELQEKLRKSEEERLKLEMKFNEMVQCTREEEQAHYRKLRQQYKRFLEEDRRRQERNEAILRALERAEGRASMLAARTERYNFLRKQYQNFARELQGGHHKEKIRENGEFKTDFKFSKESLEVPRLNQNEGSSGNNYKYLQSLHKDVPAPDTTANVVIDKYFQSLSPDRKQILHKTNHQRYPFTVPSGFPKEQVEQSNRDLRADFSDGNNAISVADEIMSSIYSKNKGTGEKFPKKEFLKNNEEYSKYLNGHSFRDEYAEQLSRLKQEDSNYRLLSTELNSDDLPPQSETQISIDQTVENGSKYPPTNNGIPMVDNHKEFLDVLKSGHTMKTERTYETSTENAAPKKRVSYLAQDETGHFMESGKGTEGLDKVTENLDEEKEQSLLNEKPPKEMHEVSENEKLDASDHSTSRVSDETRKYKEEETVQINNDVDTIQSNRQDRYDDGEKEINDTGKLLVKEQVETNENDQHFEKEAVTGQVIPQQDDGNYDQKNTQDDESNRDANQEQYNYEYGGETQMYQNYEESDGQLYQQYDESGQLQQHYNPNGEPLQEYNENGQLLEQYDQNCQPIQQYGDSGQLLQQYDENGQLLQQYDENGQPLQQYDQNGQPLQQYDENGQPYPHYDTYDQQNQALYDENGQLLQQYDENGQPLHYDQYSQQYDENGQPIQQTYDEQNQQYYSENYGYDENGLLLQNCGQEQQDTYETNQFATDAVDAPQEVSAEAEKMDPPQENAELISDEVREESVEVLKEESGDLAEPKNDVGDDEKKPHKVMEMLDTDTENSKQDTKASHDSDFDFSASQE